MHVLKRLLLLGSVAALLLAMVACGGNDDEPSATAAATRGSAATTAADDAGSDGDADAPCALLTLAEIEAAVGMPATEGSVDDTGTCMWGVGPADEFKAVYLGVGSVGLYDTVRPSQGVTDVSDVGETAY